MSTKKFILEQVEGIESKLFRSLKETTSRLGEQLRFAGLSKKSAKVAAEMFDRNNYMFLNGREAF